MTVLDAAGLVRRFGDRAVVDGVGLQIEPGECVALMGPSGCGKTTLLQMIGLLDRPDAGTVVLKGQDAWGQSLAMRAELRLRRLGFVFQHSNLIGFLSARDNVALPAWRAGVEPRAARSRADQLLEQLGLAKQAGQSASKLSIGEAQRVAVARALINEPALILADEPTGSLDAASADLVMQALTAAVPAAILVTTHNPEIAARLGRTVRMRDGKLLD